jgi:uncharacterized membrane protein
MHAPISTKCSKIIYLNRSVEFTFRKRSARARAGCLQRAPCAILARMSLDSLPIGVMDAAALGLFVLAWVLFTQAAEGRLVSRATLTSAMNRQRELWMRTMARRELRMIDTGIMNGLQQGTAFFASSSLLALGGCFALLNSADTVMAILDDLPVASATQRQLFEIKVFGLIAILAYAFFKFGWSYRLFNYCSILVGAVPVHKDAEHDPEGLEKAIMRAARMNVLAGRHFNAGLRAVFFSIGYLGWFVGWPVFMVSTVFVLFVLIRRQFFSRARAALL